MPRIRNTIPGLKWCPHCSSYKRREDFGFDVSRDDGLSGWCRGCRAGESRRRRATDPEASRDECRRRYHADPVKWKAKVAVARAVRSGKLKKPKRCGECGRERTVEAHHFAGYAKENWLNVVWMCRQCHRLDHTRGPATKRIAA